MSKNDLIQVKNLILSTFDRDEFGIFCFEHFMDVYRKWGYESSQIKFEMWVIHFVDYCDQSNQLEKLKLLLKNRNSLEFDRVFGGNSNCRVSKVINSPVHIEFVLIAQGSFLMGSKPVIDKYSRIDEQPQHTVWLSDYYISKYPVTNAQFFRFAHSTNIHTQKILGWDDHPVTGVSWFDARMFVTWLRESTGLQIRLPTEAEWEKASRGELGNIYPWGNIFDAFYANTLESHIQSTSNISSHVERGLSPFGIADMAGNVREWCLDWYSPNEYKNLERRSTVKNPLGPDLGKYRALRGGSFLTNQFAARCAARDSALPDAKREDIGFRIVLEE